MAPKSSSTKEGTKMAEKLTNKIRYYRFMNDEMTQQELADLTEVSRQTIMAIENNKYSPTLILAFKIAKVFNVSIDELFGYEEQGEKQ